MSLLYGNEKEDKWYLYKGVKPPVRQSHGMTEDNIDEKLRTNLKDHHCKWHQVGPEVYCEEGSYRHGFMIGTMKRLTGTGAGGEPLLVDV